MSNSPSMADNLAFQPVCAIFRRYLHHHGHKFTSERAAILDAVMNKSDVFEAEQLVLELAQSEHRVSKATVYRTLKHLMDSGIIQQVLLDAKQAHYQTSFGKPARGHMICVESDEIVEFDAQPLLPHLDEICRQAGIKPLSHRIVIYGSRQQFDQDQA